MQSIHDLSVRPLPSGDALAEATELAHASRLFHARVSAANWNLEMALRAVRMAETEAQRKAAMAKLPPAMADVRGANNSW